MTRHDYISIAAEFSMVRVSGRGRYDPHTWRLLRSALADAFEANDHRFSRRKFNLWCGSYHHREET